MIDDWLLDVGWMLVVGGGGGGGGSVWGLLAKG
jgi:hypothetical protein